jgi:Calcineurin-like phosphoesterase
MQTQPFHRILTIAILLALSVACAPQTPSSYPAGKLTGSPSVPPTAPGMDTEISATSPADPTSTSPAMPKPPRGAKDPGDEQVQGHGQGSDASQNMSFALPSHPFDVILGRPTTNSVVLSLLSATDQTLNITYSGENAIPQTMSAALMANIPQAVTLTGLTPGTQYYYSVNGGELQPFHTARLPGSTFTFTIQADSHLDSNTSQAVYQQTLANQRSDQPDFVIDLGDTFMTDKYKPYTSAAPQYLAQRYFLSQVGQSAPLFLILGNHDGEGASKGSDGQEMSAWAAQLRTRYFPNPAPDSFYSGNATTEPAVGFLQDYYAWEWGDALFVVLDPYWFTPPTKGNQTNLWNPTLGEAQYQWLKTTLETSRARWKFVFIHQLLSGTDKNGRGGVEVAPFYEWGGHNPDGSYAFDEYRPGWESPIHSLLVTHNVTTVFHGHDHLFIKQELDGIIYQEVPQPSAARSNNTNNAAEYGYLTGDVLGSPGHIRVTVSPDGVTVEYVRSYLHGDEKSGQQNGQVDYSYTIPAP